jgi:hypothetical protein
VERCSRDKILPLAFRGAITISAAHAQRPASGAPADKQLDLAPFGRMFALRCEFSHILYRPLMTDAGIEELRAAGVALVQCASRCAGPPTAPRTPVRAP